jgi:hypothetical protein
MYYIFWESAVSNSPSSKRILTKQTKPMCSLRFNESCPTFRFAVRHMDHNILNNKLCECECNRCIGNDEENPRWARSSEPGKQRPGFVEGTTGDTNRLHTINNIQLTTLCRGDNVTVMMRQFMKTVAQQDAHRAMESSIECPPFE